MNPRYSRYPPEVAERLRRAVYYTEIDLSPPLALKWYKEALIVADQLDMHPFSDEVLGIRLNIAMMLEKAGLAKAAIEVLEKTQADCKAWVENGRRRQMIRDRERAGRVASGTVDPVQMESEQEILKAEEKDNQLRDTIMKKVVGMGIKVAELYSSEYVRDTEKAEKALVDSVNTSVTELRRRRDMNLPVTKEGGDTFMNLAEIATAYSELADLYSKQGKHDLAATLYMHALGLIKEEEGESTTCVQVVLLNNVSSQMAEHAQNPDRYLASTQELHGPPMSRDQLLDAAAQWAKKALDVAAHIKPPTRDGDCDLACQIAAYNLGEIAEMQTNFEEARKYYREARNLASRISFEEGITKAEEALKRLKDRK
jgi:tetratricopeptide (TPR) repeat protein